MPVQLTAKQQGLKCSFCGGPIEKGDPYQVEKGHKIRCFGCPGKPVEQPPCESTPVTPVSIPSELTRIQRLSHHTSLGGYWVDLTGEQANLKIAKAAAFNKVDEATIRQWLLKGKTVECSATDWESVPDEIRDGAIVEALMDALDARQRAANKGRKFYTCRQCGARGYGGEYPFSTNPSSGLCDDCF